MGNLCTSCFGGGDTHEELVSEPDPDVRRQQALEAAERRRQENEARGIKDPSKVKRMYEKAEEIERREQEAARQGGEPVLRWQSN